MTDSQRFAFWLQEQADAHIRGWDFSHIAGRYSEEDDLPWSYRETVLQHLRPDARILDIDTGGGEFLCSLGHPYALTAATEAYPPNAALCKEKLLPLGIDFREADGKGPIPFPDASFDLVLNRHGDYHAKEIFRVLKKGGRFVTEQVGAENDRELVELLLPGQTTLPFPKQYLSIARETFENAGFAVQQAQECFRPIRFYDVGALVWFARIIEWEFPGFSVEACADRLWEAQRRIDRDGLVEGRIHRFMMVLEKR